MDLTPQEESLALELAKSLNDIDSLLSYQKMVRQFSESFLREKLNIVLETPQKKIRKTRGAYFTYLVLQYDKAKRNYPRN